MGSRVRPSPDKILECFVEVSAPEDSGKGPEIKFIYPANFEEKEALKTIPQFCFPCVSSSDAVQHYTFVLTDAERTFRFGFCRYSPDVKTCLCILSYLPWFKVFYELLNRISDLKRQNKDSEVVLILKCLLTQPPPKFGSPLTITTEEGKKGFSFEVPDTSKLPTIPEDRNLTDYFAAVKPLNMILIFASMFFERRIIVTSKKLNLLTACTYGAASLLYPMHWQHMFVPIVPPHLLDFCCAPMPFLIGIHASLMPKVRQMPLDEVVIVDADTNVVESPFDDVSQLPADTVSTLKSALKKPVYPINDNVSRAFLSAMVSVIGGYRDALRLKPGEKIFFDREIFVQSKSNSTRHLLELILQLQLFEQFIAERLDLLNAGRGFNDAFEEQIGLQAENRGRWKSQYQLWMKETMKSGGVFLDKTEEKMKKTYQGVKSNFKQVKSGLKSQFAEVKDKLKSKEGEEVGGDQKRANSNPTAVRPFSLYKLSPRFNKRRTVSPTEFERMKLETSSLKKPPRPPPPRSFPYSSERRPRTSALSTSEFSPKLQTGCSAPNLMGDPVVGELISLDDDPSDQSLKFSLPGQELTHLTEGRDDLSVPGTGSERRNSDGSDVSLERSRSSPSRPKPPVPKRPASLKKKSSGSVDAILDIAHMQPSDTISPLRPVSLSLLQDTVASLPTDAQEFLFSESDINLLNVSTNELRNSNTSVNSESDSRKESPFQENSVTMHNHLGTMDLAKLDVRRGSGPYDNLHKTKHEMTMNLDIDNAQSKADNQRKASNSSQNWVSFD
ncbi:DENN domain-containing protein 1A-like isoform X2 [Montipora foliosa]|uniref:DENN domain-containing protein 1A-like isoform X2 n=1 Tax=Montipora foliosa TaxID=591990 RepID=UPI0035F0FCE0